MSEEIFPRFELAGNENVTLICSTICAGRFIEIGMDEPQALNWLGHFFPSLRGDPAHNLDSFHLYLHTVPTAHRYGDLHSLQPRSPLAALPCSNSLYLTANLV